MEDFYDTHTYNQFFPKMSTKMDNQMYRDVLQDEIEKFLAHEKEQKLKPVDSNRKSLAALNKPRMSDVPPVALFALGAAMSDGKDKYGRFNWRETGATSSVFYDAMMRHLTDWFNGEDYANDSGVNHLGHIMASCAILLDSKTHNCLNDDRGEHEPRSISRNPQEWKVNATV